MYTEWPHVSGSFRFLEEQADLSKCTCAMDFCLAIYVNPRTRCPRIAAVLSPGRLHGPRLVSRGQTLWPRETRPRSGPAGAKQMTYSINYITYISTASETTLKQLTSMYGTSPSISSPQRRIDRFSSITWCKIPCVDGRAGRLPGIYPASIDLNLWQTTFPRSTLDGSTWPFGMHALLRAGAAHVYAGNFSAGEKVLANRGDINYRWAKISLMT